MISLGNSIRAVLALVIFTSFTQCAGGGSTKFAAHRFRSEPEIRVKVTSGRRAHIMKMPMEEYLAGVIGHEMSPRWHPQALKAQAVAARSYALYGMILAGDRKWDVVDTQADQVFRHSGTKNAYLRDLVSQTRGEVLWHDGEIVQAFYSSTCGGTTESAEGAGLSKTSPLDKSFKDTFCKISPFRTWTHVISSRELTQRLNRYGYRIKNLTDVRVVDKNPSGYANTIEVLDGRKKIELSARSFRSLANNMRIKSLLFRVSKRGSNYVFEGNGFGHGVGLCQYGAKCMADHGTDYKKILKKYYPKVEVRKIYK